MTVYRIFVTVVKKLIMLVSCQQKRSYKRPDGIWKK